MSRLSLSLSFAAMLIVAFLLATNVQSDETEGQKQEVSVMAEYMESLSAKRTQFVKQYGDKHPVVVSLDSEIKTIKDVIEDNEAKQADDPLRKVQSLDEMKDEELREIVKLLAMRVLKLEEEVKMLKHPQPEHFLLR
jgi:predicted negative regulator of RcsB-dependent stress response